MADYNSSYTGVQIDTAVGKALNPDATPISGSSNLITSGAVYTGLDAKLDANATAKMATALSVEHTIDTAAGWYKFFGFNMSEGSRSFSFFVSDLYIPTPYSGILKFFVNRSSYGTWVARAEWLALSGNAKPHWFQYNTDSSGNVELYIYKASDETGSLVFRILNSNGRRSNTLDISSGWYADAVTLPSTAIHATASYLPLYGMGNNLLRNWYFVGGGSGKGVFPVNTNGLSSYPNNNTYCIDGWFTGSNGAISIQSDGVFINRYNENNTNSSSIAQFVDNYSSLLGTTVTLSVLTANGALKYGTGTIPSAIPGSQTNIVDIGGSGSGFRYTFRIETDGRMRLILASFASNTVKLVACKLEIGNYQTLAHNENGTWILNEIPDYEDELVKCQTSTADSDDAIAGKSLATEQQVADIESGPTASKAISAGTVFCWKGDLVEATTAIASGASIVLGTNVRKTNLGNVKAPAKAGVYYGVCSAAGYQPIKAVTIDGITELYDGLTIQVYFENKNTAAGAMINLNNLGNKGIYTEITSAGPGSRQGVNSDFDGLVTFTYKTVSNYSGWLIHYNHSLASDSIYGITRLSDSVMNNYSDRAATPAAVKKAYDIAANAYLYSTAEGNPVVFEDGAALPLKSLSIDIPVTQTGSGTPSTSNIRPFVTGNSCVINYSGADTTAFVQQTVSWSESMAAAKVKLSYGNPATVTKTVVFLELDGTEDWGRIAASGSGYPYCRLALPATTWGTDIGDLCSHYPHASITSSSKNIGIQVAVSSGTPYLRMRIGTSDTVSSVTTFLAQQKENGTPVQVVYNISEANQTAGSAASSIVNPDMQYGENHIWLSNTNTWASAGTMTAVYGADPTSVSSTKANQAQLAVVESGSTASKAYVMGEYFCWNGLLYRAKTAISVGQSFTPGTNCEQVNVGDELSSRCRSMTKSVAAGKSADIVIYGSNYAPAHGFLLISTGNSGAVMGAWLCLGLGVRYNFHVIHTLYTSGSPTVSVTSTVDGKYTYTNTNTQYGSTISVVILQESGGYLTLSDEY